MEKTKKKRITKEKIVIFFVTIVVTALLVYFLKDILIAFIKLQVKNDKDAASALLKDKGAIGYLMVSVIEALQMVVIFIPAEFIQLTSSMTYPWYVALIMCDIGVILGASIIYFLVHIFKFNGDIFNKGDKIKKYDKSNNEKSLMILMYFLFVMPIIPFGAICYYASNKKIKYYKYIITCATGVLPSIMTSILMGTAIKEFITNSLPLPLLILAIFVAAAILFIGLLFILNKFYFKQNDKTPDSIFYNLLMKHAKFFIGKKVKVSTNNDLSTLKKPFILLANHSSFYDHYFINQINPDIRYSFITNRYYFNLPILKTLAIKIGFIPKKIFDSDIETIKKTFQMRDLGYPIVMFPEGRLSTDGALMSINPKITNLVKKLGIDLVLVRINNAYLAKPKWRKKAFKTNINIDVRKIISADELKDITNEDLFITIKNELSYDSFNSDNIYKQKNKAKGLDTALYMCPYCNTLYSNISKNNFLECTNCHKSLEIDEKYHFKDDKIHTIKEYMDKIRDYERSHLEDLNISCHVNTKIFKEKSHKYDKDRGYFTLTNEKVIYKSEKTDYEFEIEVKNLEGIAYSAGVEFELYYKNRLHYFYPINDKDICARISLIYELLKEKEE